MKLFFFNIFFLIGLTYKRKLKKNSKMEKKKGKKKTVYKEKGQRGWALLTPCSALVSMLL